jgi:hypothetical protein
MQASMMIDARSIVAGRDDRGGVTAVTKLDAAE